MSDSVSSMTEEDLAEIVKSAQVVAVVGMKDDSDPSAPAYRIPRIIQGRGLRVIPVNPKISASSGERAYPDIASLPERVDIIDVFRRADAIEGIADEVLALPKEKRPRVFWMQLGIRHEEAARRLSAEGIRVVQDRCLGVYSEKYRAKI